MEPEQSNQTPGAIADALGVVEAATAQNPQQPVLPAPVVAADPVKPTKPPFFKRKRVLIGAAAVFVVLVAGAAAFFMFGKEDNQGLASDDTHDQVARLGAAVTVLDGTATYSHDGEEWLTLTTSSQLSEGDTVRTEVSSRVVLALDDGSAIRMDETTTVKLARLTPDNIEINNQTGQVYSRVVSSDRSFTVNVAESSYTALGTAFSTENGADNKGVKVLQSAVKSSTTAEVGEGKQYYTQHTKKDLENKVTDIPVDELKEDNFLLWNLEQDEQNEQFRDKLGYWQKVKKSTEDTPAETVDGLKLSAKTSDKGTVLSWTIQGLSAPDGFKIIRSQTSTSPTFGKDEAHYVNKPAARSYTWGTSKAGVFHYRICIYDADKSSCSAYSNVVTIKSSAVLPTAVQPGAVQLNTNDENMLNWTFEGTAPHGFKVVVSSDENPEYPKDSIALVSGTSHKLKAEGRSAGSYYVRVCKYTGSSEVNGGCTDYSNQVLWIIAP